MTWLSLRSPWLALPRLAPLVLVAGLGAALALPKPDADPAVQRPPRPLVAAAFQRGSQEIVRGRIASEQRSGVVLRLQLGIRKVATIRHTQYFDKAGTPQLRSALHRGDSVVVTGYMVGSTLVAAVVRDSSR